MDRTTSHFTSRYSSQKSSSIDSTKKKALVVMASTVGVLPPSTNTTGSTGKNAWSQLDQLLTCAICLDRYRNPKLLPCQHTFCMDPCLEGLIDYIRRQIKCPECRAEHRIPYQGIQGYPTNVTLMRFLELHFEVTGETPDLTPTIKERCGVCSEKAYLASCGHCEKKVCPDCKEAHVDILRREIARINNQVRRGLHRLQDALGQAEKSVVQLQLNCANVTQEIEEIFRRLQKAIKDREDTLKTDVQTLLQTELRNLTQLKDNLEVEVNNIQSNCELIEKHVNDTTDWEDIELVDYKETFLKTLDFVRNFDPDQAEFSSRLRLQAGTDPEMMIQNIAHLGDLTVNCPQFPAVNSPATANQNLMRSKSDHRLATQFHRQEEQQQQRGYLGVGQRYSGHSSDTETRHDGSGGYRRSITDRAQHDDGERFGSKRYGSNWQREDDASSTSSYRSRFARDDSLREGSDPEAVSGRAVRFARNDQTDAPAPRERLFDSEDAIRGPLSGIGRLLDSPIVIRRIQQNEQKAKQKLEEKLNPPAPQPQPVPPPAPVAPAPAPVPPRRTQRQISEDDEIAKIKALNKDKPSSSSATPAAPSQTPTTPTTDARPVGRRVAALQKDEETPDAPQQTQTASKKRTGSRQDEANTEATTKTTGRRVSRSSSRDESSREPSSSHGTSRQNSRDPEFKTPPSTPTRKLSVESTKSDVAEPEGSVAARRRFFTRQASENGPKLPGSKTPSISESSKSQSSSDNDDKQSVTTPAIEENSDDETTITTKGRPQTPATKTAPDGASSSSSESTSGSPARSTPVSTKSTSAVDDGRSSSFRRGESTKTDVKSPVTPSKETTSVAKPKFVSRFLPRQSTTESNKSSSDSDSDSDDDKEAKEAARDASICALLARSAIARRESVGSGSGTGGNTTGSRATSVYGSRGSDDALSSTRKTTSSYLRDKDSDTLGDRYSSLASRYPLSRRSSSTLVGDDDKDDIGSRYGSSYASRYLSRSKSSAALGNSERDLSPEVDTSRSGRTTSGSTGADRYRKESRFSALRRNRLGRSRSSHDIALRDDDDDDDEPASSYTPASSYRSPSKTSIWIIRMPSYLFACPSRRNVMVPKALVLQYGSGTPLLLALIVCHVTQRAKQRVRSGPCRMMAFAYAYRSNAQPRPPTFLPSNQRRPLACVFLTTTSSTRDYGLSGTTSSSYRPSYSSYKPSSYYTSSRY